MKKLNLLKTIVDYFWVISLIATPLFLFFVFYLLFTGETLDIPIKINGLEVKTVDLASKIILIFGVFSYLLFLYGIYYFKKLLYLFQLRKIFVDEVVDYFNKIGYVFLLSAILAGIPLFIYKILKNEVNLELGGSPFLYLISLGLFFLVLSEVFKIAKNMKEENDLTV
ncbi:DUF2975 domain-containing protein [Flavobacterium sp.]|uniref:DUF2975 domain-containing protein n=1 Tax=Flavobacterium sp. TaxID=239 RepID=UPI00374DDFB4